MLWLRISIQSRTPNHKRKTQLLYHIGHWYSLYCSSLQLFRSSLKIEESKQQCVWKSLTVFRTPRSSWKCWIFLRSLKQFLKVSNSSQDYQTILRSLIEFSEVSNDSQKPTTVLRSLKHLKEALGNAQKSKNVSFECVK